MKKCSGCQLFKPEEAFYKHAKHKDGLNNYCKLCNRAYATTHRDSTRRSVRKANWRKYGITMTEKEFNSRLAEQGGRCSICSKIPGYRLAVDHDHKTGKTRGLLCRNCNRALGYFEDSTSRLLVAINYLRSDYGHFKK